MPKIYDIKIDDYREVTDEDIALLNTAAQAYGRLRDGLLKLLVDERDTRVTEITAITREAPVLNPQSETKRLLDRVVQSFGARAA